MKADRDGFLITAEPASDETIKKDIHAMRESIDEQGLTFPKAVAKVADVVRTPVANTAQTMANIDPSLKAMGEIAEPLGRVAQAGKSTFRTMAAMWVFMRSMRKKDDKFQKANTRLLEEIRDKPSGAGGAFGGLLSKLPLPALMTGTGAIGGALGGLANRLLGRGKPNVVVPGGAAGKAAGKGGGFLGKAKGWLSSGKKLPIIGGLIAAGSAAFDYSNAQTPQEKHRAIGGGIGAVGGAVLGSLFGPVGTVVGGIVGDMAGKAVGEKYQAWAPVIEGQWQKVIDFTSSGLETVITKSKGWYDSITEWTSRNVIEPVAEKVSGAVETVKGGYNAAVDTVSRNVIEPVANAYNSAVSATTDVIEAGAQTYEKARSFFADIFETIGNGVSKSYDTLKDSVVNNEAINYLTKTTGSIVAQIKNWVLGQTSARFESRSGAGTVSTGRGDHGGVSYGTYQMATNTGTADRFAQQSKYAKEFAGLKAGTDAFSAKWKELAARDPQGFAAAQHEYIKKTHFDPAAKALAATGFDVSKRGAAVHDAIWSTAVQFGPARAARMFNAANAGVDMAKLSDQQLVERLQDYKIRNNNALFASSSVAVRQGTLNRAIEEKRSLVSLAKHAPPTIGEIERHQIVASSPSVNVKVQKPDAGQDVKDRSIAHIVTGGLSQ